MSAGERRGGGDPDGGGRPATAPDDPLARASFHPNLRWYRYLQGAGLLVASVVGIAALPVWLAAGWWWSSRYWEKLECELGERTLSIGYGIWFRTEKSIPLEQIQDVSVRHGPLLNWLGLTKLKIETAGQGSSQQAAGDLVGVEEPIAFRDRVLEQRERLSDRRSGVRRASGAGGVDGGAGERAAGTGAPASGPETAALLAEIRDALLRIEERLEGDAGG